MRDQAAHPKQLSSCPGQSALSTPGSLPASSGWTPGAPPAWLSLHGQRWVLSTCPQHWPCCGVSINPPPLEVGSKPPPGQGPDVETAWRGWASSSVGGVHLKAVTLMSGLPPNATPFPSAHPEPKEVRETRFITLSSKFSDSLLGLLVLCSKPSSPSPKLPLPRPFWNQHPCVTGSQPGRRPPPCTRRPSGCGTRRPNPKARRRRRRAAAASGQESPLRWAGKKFEEVPIAHIKASYNNTQIQVVSAENQPLARASCGTEGFRNAKKGTGIAAQTAGIAAAAKATGKGVTHVRVVVKGLGPGRLSAIKGLTMGGLEVISITDNTPIPHNGCRPRKARRL
ncbi:28S ribosomal protein S11, mitochondrial isoform X2 [Talpa occidentalis]|nr:28S ribosomal protein S11, mitochondrial isoform X2 [Talpa occidentalis]